MNPILLNAFNVLEDERKKIIKMLAQINENQFSRTMNGKWSISQILTHIITSEQLALSYMKKKSLGVATLKNSGWAEPIKLALLKISQRLPIRYKVPKEISTHTPPPFALAETIIKWEESRLALKDFLESIHPTHTNKKIFKHPVLGRFNAEQGIIFLREHIIHHLPQIKRLLN